MENEFRMLDIQKAIWEAWTRGPTHRVRDGFRVAPP